MDYIICTQINVFLIYFINQNKCNQIPHIDFLIFQQVELLVDNEKYAEFDIHKGDIGTIIEDVAVQDYILVNFGRLDENNNYHGDCISVRLKDVKILEKNKD